MRIHSLLLIALSIGLSFLSSGALAQCGDCQFLSENLVENGDFEAGNTGFTSDYALATVNGPWGLLSYEGQYVIGSNANNFHSFFQGFDHTNPPFGNYMMVNGSSVPNTNVWCQSIEVIPGQWYDFSAWVRNIDTNPDNSTYAELQFFIDGDPIGAPFTADGGWEEIAVQWFSEDYTNIDICLKNQQNEGGGNDFGVDDISFITCIDYVVTGTANAGEDQTICSGEQVTLGTPELANFNYDWDGPSLNVVQQSQAQPSVTLFNNTNAPQTFTYSLTIDSLGLGCTTTDEVVITVNPLPEPDLGPDQVLCEGDELVLNAGNGWELVVWQDGSTGATFTADEAGTYEATVTALGCSFSDEVEVIAPDLPAIELGPDTSICVDQTFVFDGGASGLWSTGEVGESIEVNTEGWYWLQVESQGCTDRDSVYLTVIEYPQLSLEPLIELCPDETYTYYVSQEGVWSNGTVADSLQVSSPGVYGVTLNNQQCIVSDESEVAALELPSVDLGEDQVLCVRDVVKYDVSSEWNENVLWSDAVEEFEREFTESGLYGVLVWNQCGTDEDEVTLIFEDCDYALYVPNAFTPDGDGVNEVWCPVGLNLTSIEIRVFNRWGEEVFFADSFDDMCWNGNHQNGGYYVPDGVYAYRIVAFTDRTAEPIEETGSIVITR